MLSWTPKMTAQTKFLTEQAKKLCENYQQQTPILTRTDTHKPITVSIHAHTQIH